MILGIGTDIVQVDRFKRWKNYSEQQLLRVFSDQEIIDCSRNGVLGVQRLAARFAAKEAFYKSFSSSLVKLNLTEHPFSFLFACQNIEVVKPVWNVPKFRIDWQAFEGKIGKKLPTLQVDLSISHEKLHVISFVIITV